MKKLMMIIAFFLCIYFVKVAFWPGSAGDGDVHTADPVALAAEEDSWVQEDLAQGTHSDAALWLKQKGNIFLEGDIEKIQALIDGLHTDGAVKVWITGIERFRDANLASSIAVELPSDPTSRKAIFRREGNFRGGYKHASKDVGQRYLAFYFD